MNPKASKILALIPPWLCVAAVTATSGCLSSKTPYDYMENWLIREDAVRPFAVPVDVIYVQDHLYVSMNELPKMLSTAHDAVGRGKFSGFARVFSPLVASEEDVENAVEWYIKHHNKSGRSFVMIGEGEGGALLKAYAEENAEWLEGKGLLGFFFTEVPYKDFVSKDMIRTIRNRAAAVRYQREWDREIPPTMFEEGQTGE